MIDLSILRDFFIFVSYIINSAILFEFLSLIENLTPFSLFKIIVLGVHCDIYKSSYNISNIIILEFIPSIFLLYPPPSLIPGIVSKALIFPFTYMYTQYLHYIHSPTLSPHLLYPSTGTNPPDRVLLSCSSVL
jgi:hypothetical protein